MKTFLLNISGIGAVEVINYAPIEEWVKIGSQAILAIAALVGLIRKSKKNESNTRIN